MIIPEEVKQGVIMHLKLDSDGIKGFSPASGGCINNGGTLSTTYGDFFIKWNSSSRFPDMFNLEGKGLKKLSGTNEIRIPQVQATGKGSSYQWILMDNIRSAARSSTYWENLGHQLAIIHKNSSKRYGLEYDNYIGSLLQKNDLLDNWIEFLIINRFKPMIAMALENNKIDQDIAADFEKLFPKLNHLLVHDKPALLHGDLWNGNLMVDENGEPALIDPAIYYGNHEIELAFTTMFGGFDQEFYDAYQDVYPLEAGYKDRFEIYNLYPLMVHVNLFGGSYISQVRQVLRRYV